MFFSISGGPYGLEPLLRDAGPGGAILLIALIPVIWCLPVILLVLEMNGMMPMEGGYYQWVKAGLGERWGFFEGWWTWLYAMTDLAIYPVLFVEYLSFLFPGAGALRLPICLAVVWGCALLNLRGIVSVGRSAGVLGAIVLAPFIILFAAVFFGPAASQAAPHGAAGPLFVGGAALGMGLFNVMWNFLGWDNAHAFAEEVESPVRSYTRAIAWALAIITIAYRAALAAEIRSGIDPGLLADEGYPALGRRAAGWWLGAVIAAGGMASALGLFLASLLAISRIPKVLADDRLLPSSFAKLHPATEVPHVAIVACAAVVSLMILWDFGDLLVIDVTLYSAALMPEFVALIALRRNAPGRDRPFRIPVGTRGLVVIAVFPALCIVTALVALFASGTAHLAAGLFALGTAATVVPAWFAARAYRSRRPR